MADTSLVQLVAATLGVEASGLTEGSGMNNTKNWDSLRQVVLMTELERVYGVEFEFDQMSAATTIAEIREILREKGVEAA